MGIKTITSREWKCDRCPAEAVYESDSEAAKSGWTLMTINDRHTKVLCPTDRNWLDFFLMGQKTPVGQKFNANERERVER